MQSFNCSKILKIIFFDYTDIEENLWFPTVFHSNSDMCLNTYPLTVQRFLKSSFPVIRITD